MGWNLYFRDDVHWDDCLYVGHARVVDQSGQSLRTLDSDGLHDHDALSGARDRLRHRLRIPLVGLFARPGADGLGLLDATSTNELSE